MTPSTAVNEMDDAMSSKAEISRHHTNERRIGQFLIGQLFQRPAAPPRLIAFGTTKSSATPIRAAVDLVDQVAWLLLERFAKWTG